MLLASILLVTVYKKYCCFTHKNRLAVTQP